MSEAAFEEIQASEKRPYSLGEEIANSVIHGIGVVLSIAALVILVAVAVLSGDPFKLAAASSTASRSCSSTQLHALPRLPAAAGEARLQDPRPLRHLPAHRGHLHAVLPRDAAGRRWLVALRGRLGARDGGHRAGGVLDLPAALALGARLPRLGLARRARHQSADARPRTRRACGCWSPAASPTRSGRSSTCSRRCPTCTRSGTSACLRAARCHFLAVLLFVMVIIARVRRTRGSVDPELYFALGRSRRCRSRAAPSSRGSRCRSRPRWR